MLKQLCICDQCGHVWVVKEVPERCAGCHKRTWNGKKSTSAEQPAVKELPPPNPYISLAIETGGDWPKPVAELEDTAEPYQASEKPKRKVAGEPTLVSSLCRHGLYVGRCPRCA